MRILTIGDVVGKNGCEFLRSKLSMLKKDKKIDIVIANGENSAEGNGILPCTADNLFSSGVDVITNGNHTFRRKEIRPYLDDNKFILRPANYPINTTPGRGFCRVDMGHLQICVINLLGTVYMESLENPFDTVNRIIRENQDCKIKIVDFHAEATAEKRAMGFYLDSKVSVVFGTHTHVQTSDECILPMGTGYITDVGMTGVIHSVLGVNSDISIKRMTEKLPIKFENAHGACKMECVIFEVSEETGKCTGVERLRIMPQYKSERPEKIK